MQLRDSMVYIVGRLVPGLVGVLSAAALTRMLGPTEYGQYGLALVIMSFGATMIFDWLGVSFLRFYQARRDDPRIISTIIQIFLGLMAALAAAAALAYATGLVPAVRAPIFASGLVLACSYAWFELAARFEIADFRAARYLVMNLGRSALILGGATGGAYLGGSAVWTALGSALGMLAGTLLGTVGKWRVSRRTFDPTLARQLATFGAPVAASLIMNGLILSGTRALIEVFGSSADLGYYTATVVLVQNALWAVAGGIASAGYSLAVRAVETGDPAIARRQLEANGTLLIAVLAPAALGMALTASGIAHLFLGAGFADPVARITPWMAAATFLWCIRAHHLDHAFQLGRRPALQIRVTAVAAAVSLGLSALLIPRVGPVGVAMAITAAMAVACVHAWAEGLRAYPIPLPMQALLRTATACAAMAVVVLAIPGSTAAGFTTQAIAGAAVYCVAGVAMNLLGSRAIVAGWIAQFWPAPGSRRPDAASLAKPVTTSTVLSGEPSSVTMHS